MNRALHHKNKKFQTFTDLQTRDNKNKKGLSLKKPGCLHKQVLVDIVHNNSSLHERVSPKLN